MKARLVAVGERAPSWVAEGFAEYRKRLSHWLPLDLVEIEPGLRGKGRDTARATSDEGARVLAAAVPGHRKNSRNACSTGATVAATWPCSSAVRRATPMTSSPPPTSAGLWDR